ncbi:MAG: hypothetical protein ACXVAE_06030 [Candidatus Limnocylindrales bacterium]
MRSWLGRALRTVIWLLVAAGVALGAAGIVTGAAPPPGDATRPELTVRADQRLEPGLSALETGLGHLEGQLGQLVGTGKAVLVELAAQPAGQVTSSDVAAKLDQGDALVLAISQQAQQLQAAYAQLPYDASSDRISGRSSGRLLAVRAALGAVAPVAADWQVASARATVTTHLIGLLLQHDQLAGQAVFQGSAKDAAGKPKQPDFAGAMVTLGQAAEALGQAATIRDQLRQTIDVSTLTSWLDRNRTWDQAIGTYFRLAQTSRDLRVLQRAFDAEEAARAVLPKTTDALVVVVGAVEGAGLTAALADLEQIRARLALVARVD